MKQHDATQRAEGAPQRVDENDSPPDRGLLLLQSLVGNRAINAKLEIGDVDSPHEREADVVARRVVNDRPTEPGVDGVRAAVEEELGADLSSARIHLDDQADHMSRSINAKAFTTGSDVYFKAGAFDAESQAGRELIAHEFTHVAQQNPGVISRAPDDEEEAGDTLQVPKPEHQEIGKAFLPGTEAEQAHEELTANRAARKERRAAASEGSTAGPTTESPASDDSDMMSATSNAEWGDETKPDGMTNKAKSFAKKNKGKGAYKAVSSGANLALPGVGNFLDGFTDGALGAKAERDRRKIGALEPATAAGAKHAEYAASKKATQRNKGMEKSTKNLLLGGAAVAAAAVLGPVALVVGAAGLGIKGLRKGLSVWHRRGRSLRAFAQDLATQAATDPDARARAAALGVEIEEGEQATKEQVDSLYRTLKDKFGNRRKYWATEIANALDNHEESVDYQDALDLCKTLGVDLKALLGAEAGPARVKLISDKLESD